MKQAHLRLILATGIYGVFMAVFLAFRHGFPGGTIPAVIATVIYVSLMSLFLHKRST
jgi:hypothetical protein